MSRGPPSASPHTSGHDRWFSARLLSLLSFDSGLGIGSRNIPPSSSRLCRGYSRAPRGAALIYLIALTGQRSTLRRLRRPANDVVAERGAGNKCLSGGRRVSSSGDWDLGNPAFAISHGPRDTTAMTPGLTIASLACCCSFHLSDPGKPLDPRTLLRVPPGCTGDTTERLAAHFASRSSDTRRGIPPSSRSAYRPNGPDPDGVTAFRTHEQRPGWVLSRPRGRRCSSRPSHVLDRRLPLYRGQSLHPAPTSIARGSA